MSPFEKLHRPEREIERRGSIEMSDLEHLRKLEAISRQEKPPKTLNAEIVLADPVNYKAEIGRMDAKSKSKVAKKKAKAADPKRDKPAVASVQEEL